jgi:dihydrofolate reductase
MHLSLDGYVAGPNGELDWVTVNDEIFNHVGKRISEGDSAMYGRVTYNMMESYWPSAGAKPNATRHELEHSQWYAGIHKLVVSKSMKGMTLPRTSIISDNIQDKINEIKQRPGKEILLFGSPATTHSLIQLNLIDGYWLFVNPIILGKGIPLFKNIEEKIKLRLLNTQQFTGGVTELNYIVER